MKVVSATQSSTAPTRVHPNSPETNFVEDIKLKALHKFTNTAEALAAVTGLVEGKCTKELKTFLAAQDITDKLVVCDAKLATSINKKLQINAVYESSASEVVRAIRENLSTLLGVDGVDVNAMQLGLSHSLSRYKLKFSPDKVDTMIIQAINLLDDLDKELNTYAMRVKEWYGWHFPEMTKIVLDNVVYAKTIKLMGFRTNAAETDLSSILPADLAQETKDAAEISMGTEISDEDILNITYLCDQIISISEYRGQLFDYLKNRMAAIAPNLTSVVGEIVGAKLIAHAGSLMNLAKYPASTVQILGAEKALFRALKTKHDTPKYGLIYHASLVGQAAPKHKGKIARVLATKASLSVRCDALGDSETPEIGLAQRAKVEHRLRQLEGKALQKANGGSKSKTPSKKFEMKSKAAYNPSTDVVMTEAKKMDAVMQQVEAAVENVQSERKEKKQKSKRKAEDEEKGEEKETKAKKAKKAKKEEA